MKASSEPAPVGGPIRGVPLWESCHLPLHIHAPLFAILLSSANEPSSSAVPSPTAQALIASKTAPPFCSFRVWGGGGFQLLLAQGCFTIPIILLTPLHRVPSLNSPQSAPLNVPSVSCWEAESFGSKSLLEQGRLGSLPRLLFCYMLLLLF